jgi:hypothetical protein
MRASLAVVLFVLSVSAFAQTDTLTFWNGEYMVVRNDSVVYPIGFIKEQAAEYPGGDLALSQFIAKNVKMPMEARHKKVYGRVDAIFYVSKSGLPTKITVRGDTTLGRGEAARQLVKAMPRWRPAIQNGRVVQMRIAVPVGFTTEGVKWKK